MIIGLSSMATRPLLSALVPLFEQRSGLALQFESVGGVDAQKRVLAGEAFDVVVLASDAIDTLEAAGMIRAGERADIARSQVAVAVRSGAPRPDIGSEDATRRVIEAARALGYSSGPSGVQLLKLFERWGIASALMNRLVQAPPGVPVGTLLASGQVDLGFQQLSELMHVDGIEILGTLPAPIQIVTTFTAGICTRATHVDAARAVLAFLTSPLAFDAIRQNGMDPA